MTTFHPNGGTPERTSVRIQPRTASTRRRARRRMLKEQLEARQLLAADGLMGPIPAEVSTPALSSAEANFVETIDDAAAIGADGIESFGSGLRQTVQQISRVLSAVENASGFAAEVPYLGELLPDAVGGSSVLDTQSIRSLLNLATRFDTEVLQPLEAFLDSNPTATVAGLIAEFDFLEAAEGLASGQTGVRLDFAPVQTFDATLAGLLEPITSQAGSILQSIDGELLSQALPFRIDLQDFNFDIIRDAAENFTLTIPDVSLSILSESIPLNFAANVGVLAGGVTDGVILADLGVQLNTSDILGESISLDALRGLSIIDELSSLQVEYVGNGITMDLPFDFELGGFDVGGFLPTLRAVDDNPFDDRFPEFELIAPTGADYDADMVSGFATINATSILSTIDELGSMFGAWESGEVLNHPLPLGDNVSVGDVAGFADAFSGAVLQFLRDDEGLPAFDTIQELANLIPQAADAVNDFVSYDKDTRTITLDLGFGWVPEDIVAQANLSVIAGGEDSPIASVTMNPGEDGTNNRLTISREVAFDFQVEIGLGRPEPAKVNVVEQANRISLEGQTDAVKDDRANLATPMMAILRRMGLADVADTPQKLRVRLNDPAAAPVVAGVPAGEIEIDMGTIDPHVTLGEWLERGTYVGDNDQLLVTLDFEPTVIAGSPLGNMTGRFIVRDHTAGTGRVDIQFQYLEAPGSNRGVFDQTAISDEDVPWARTLGELRRWGFEQIAEHLEGIIGTRANLGTFDTVLVQATFDPSLEPAGANFDYAGTLASANAANSFFGLAPTTDPSIIYPIAQIASISGINPSAIAAGPHIKTRFNPRFDWDFDTSGAADPNRSSFLSTGTHELLHGLGFLSNILGPAIDPGDPPGGSFDNNAPSLYDTFLVNIAPGVGGAAPVVTPLTAPGTTNAQRLAAITSGTAANPGTLFSVAPNSVLVNPAGPGSPLQMYAPASFEPGSSRHHFDQATFAPFDETMVPRDLSGSDVAIGISTLSAAMLTDLGYAQPPVATTAVTSNDEFWNRFFETDTTPFSVPTSINLNLVPFSDILDTPLAAFEPALADLGAAPIPTLRYQLRDGTTDTVNLGTASGATFRDFTRLFRTGAPGGEGLSVRSKGDTIFLKDTTMPIAGGRFSIGFDDPADANHPIGRLLPPEIAPADSAVIVLDRFIRTLPRSTTISRNTPLFDILTPSEYNNVLNRDHYARISRIDGGDAVQVSTGVLNPDSTVGTLLDALTVRSGGDIQVQAYIAPGDDRITLHDRLGVLMPAAFSDATPPGPTDKVALEIEDLTGGGGIFDLLFEQHRVPLAGGAAVDANPDGDEFLTSDSLGTRRGTTVFGNDERVIAVEKSTQAAPGLPLGIVLDRLLPRSELAFDQSATFLLTNGSQATITLPGDPRSYTSSSALEAMVISDPLVSVYAADRSWIVADSNGGSVNPLTLVDADPLFDRLFNGGQAFGTVLQTVPLSSTTVGNTAGEAPISVYLDGGLVRDEDGELAAFASLDAAAAGGASPPIEIRLRDGTVRTIEPIDWQRGLDHLDLIDRFTLFEGSRQLTEAWIENRTFNVRDLTTGVLGGTPNDPESIFDLRTSIRYSEGSSGSLFLSRILPLGIDFDGDRVLHGLPLYNAFPSVAEATVDATTTLDGIVAGLAAGDEVGQQQSVLMTSSDGIERRIDLGVLDDKTTLGDLVNLLAVEDTPGVPLTVAQIVEGSRIFISNTGGGTLVFRPDPMSEGSLFRVLGLLGPDGSGSVNPTDEVTTRELLLSPVRLTASLGDLFDADSGLFSDGTTTLAFDPGDAVMPVSGVVPDTVIGPFTPDQTLADLLIALTVADPADADRNLLSSALNGDSIVVTHAAGPSSALPAALSFEGGNEDLRQTLEDLFGLSLDFNNDGRFVSESLATSAVASPADPATPIREVVGAARFDQAIAGGDIVPVRVALRDGTTANIQVGHAAKSMRSYLDQFTIERDGEVVLGASLQQFETDEGGVSYRPVFTDFTSSTGSTPLSITVDHANAPSPEAAALPIELGIVGVDQFDTGKITGPELKTSGASNRRGPVIRIPSPPRLYASFGAVASDVNATAAIGEILTASVENGSASLTGSVELTIPIPDGQGFLSIGDLTRAIVNPFSSLELNLDADLQIGAELFVDVGGLNEQPTDPDEIPRIDVAWPDALTADPRIRLQTENFEITTENLDNLLDFSDVTIQDVIELITRVVDFVGTIAVEDLLGQDLPLIGVSLGEVLAVADDVAGLVEQLQNDPGGLLNQLEAEVESALGLSDEQFDLYLDTNAAVVRADLNLDYDVSTTRSLNLDLSEISGFDTLDNFVDFTGSGEIGVDASATLRAHLGLDTAAVRAGDVADAVRVYDTSGVAAEARLFADDLNFTTSVLSLEAAVVGGRAAFDRDGLNFNGTAESIDPVDISITAGDWPGGFKTLTSLTPDDFESDLGLIDDAAIGVDLPLTINGTASQLQLQWDDLDSFQFTILDDGTPITTQSGNVLAVPDIAAAIDSITLGDGIAALATGLQGLFESLETQLGDQILGIDVPLIGEALEDAVEFVDRFVAPMADAFNQGFDDSPQLGDEVQTALFGVLGPAGLNVVGDQDNDGNVTSSDIGIITFDENDRAIGFDLELDLGSLTRSLPINLDLGGSGIGMDIAGDVGFSAGLTIDVGVGIDLDAGPFVQFGDGQNLGLEFYAGIDDLVADGRFGPLAVQISTIDAGALSASRRQAARIDPNDESTEAINAIRGGFGINFPAGTYTIGNLGDAFDGIQVTTEFVGSVHAHIDTGLNTATEGLPTIVADLHLNFDAVVGSIDDVIDSISSPRIELTNAGLDLGTFVADVIAPILGPVQDFLEPLQPTIETLTQPIPVLSDILGPTTFIDLIGTFGSGGETVARFVDAVIAVNDAIVSLPLSADGLVLPLGNFTIETDTFGNATPRSNGGAENIDDFLEDADNAANDAAEYLRELPRGQSTASAGGSTTVEPGKFAFPIFDDPASAIGLLFGNDIDLVKFQAPTLNAEFGFNIGIPVFPAFNITFGGQFNAIIDFAFGYDTAGIRQFAESGRALDLLNGFYLDDYRQVGVDEAGNPIFEERPELTFAFAVTAGGEIDLAVAKAGVQAELGARLLLDLNDPDGDTRVRLDELAANLQLGNAPGLGPLWIFDASGQLTAALTAYAKAFGIRVSATLGPKVLVNYDFPRPQPAEIVLGRVEDDGTLVIHTGPEAANRVGGDATDIDETVFVEIDEETGNVLVTGFGKTDKFIGVQRLLIDTGDGDDTVVVDATFDLPATITAGDGNDDITVGSGPTTVYGGWGDDLITGGDADDRLFGQGTSDPRLVTIPNPDLSDPDAPETIDVLSSDNDQILGGGGADIIVGGFGDDNLKGDAGNDRVEGNQGDDFINGGDGDDILIGGDGEDVVSGDGGDDTGYGDEESEAGSTSTTDGPDVLLGGPGADRLFGGGGNDELFGGLGSDQLFGGNDDDLIVGAITSRDDPNFESIQTLPDIEVHTLDGGTGRDRIYGTAGTDTVFDAGGRTVVFTYEGNDYILTGDENDTIDSGTGDDTVNAGDGANIIMAGGGFDIVTTGSGPDVIDLRPAVIIQNGRAVLTTDTSGGQVTDGGGNNRILTDDGDDTIDVLGSGVNFINAGGGDNFIRTVGQGGDFIRTGAGDDVIDAGDGDNDISTGDGVDDVTTGTGRDSVFLGAGDDRASTGSGDDTIVAGIGNDWVDAGGGSDFVRGGAGDDDLVGGVGSDTIDAGEGIDVVWGGLRIYIREELLAELTTPDGYDASATAVELDPIVPVIVGGPLEGSLEDGNDLIRGGGGLDFLFGGGGRDRIESGDGQAYIDGGRGNDILTGGDDHDVIRGGDGDDDVQGFGGIDFSFGDGGDDFIRGGAGVDVDGVIETRGQRSFGGDGNDVIWAWAASTSPAETLLDGEYLDGGQGADELLGNLRRDELRGGGGDDRLLGDELTGPVYQPNVSRFILGGDDLIVGGFGDDLLAGHGGNDRLFGGGNVDELEGHDGDDELFGGRGIDFLRLDVRAEYGIDNDVLDGGRTNAPEEGPFGLDNSTDVLIINGVVPEDGSSFNDNITIAGDGAGQAVVRYNGRDLPIVIKDTDGNTLVEQFQINGLAGDDTIGFDPSFDTSDLAARSRDWVGVFQGGSGDDRLTGSAGRDRLDGGSGDDDLFGLGGDDRLFGDSGEGSSDDFDQLFGGTGNDDLLGGIGRNDLYAWSSDPNAGASFGVFAGNGELEDTGLNRMLGRDQDDRLFAGTGLDFMYGGDGDDQLFDVDGNLLEQFGVPQGDEWLEYARNHDSVWYYGGSGLDDRITVDYVTEPGLLGGHHLITRQTENNGFFSFDATVRLDFAATNPDGTLVWDPSDLVQRVEEIQDATDEDTRRLAARSLELSGDLLPPEGDFLAIIVNAGAGDDEVRVGPTVQKTVWVAAGEGDDVVEYESGTAILVDIGDADRRNEVIGDPDDFSAAFDLTSLLDDNQTMISDTTYFEFASLDSPTDIDWYSFTVDDMTFAAGSQFVIDSLSDNDQIELQLFEYDAGDDNLILLQTGAGDVGPSNLDSRRTSRTSLSIAGQSFSAGQQFFIRVRSLNDYPTSYNLGIDLADELPLGNSRVALGTVSDTFLRRDVLVGGPGDDILRGGPSEDWVIGGSGDDILTGGIDGNASDILVGEDGDDTFQIIPTLDGGLNTTLADEIEGGDGVDRVLYLGGDVDDFGNTVPDVVTLRYQPLLSSYELAAKVWDTANQTFLVDGDEFVIATASYRTRGVELTEFDTRDGDDEVHLEEASVSILPDSAGELQQVRVGGFQFDRPDGSSDERESYGISPGDFAGGALASSFIIEGGAGNDRLFGSPFDDIIRGGTGIDQIVGGKGNDDIDGGSGGDLLIGDDVQTGTTLFDRFEFTINGDSNSLLTGARPIDLSSGTAVGLSLHEGDATDWYLLPLPADGEALSNDDITLTLTDPLSSELFAFSDVAGLQVLPAALDPVTDRITVTDGTAEMYLVGVTNPTASALVAGGPLLTDLISPDGFTPVEFRLQTRSLGFARRVNIILGPSKPGSSVAQRINDELESIGVDDHVRAFYDVARERLLFLSSAGQTVTITGNELALANLGFADGQTSGQAALGLGEYQLTTPRDIPSPTAATAAMPAQPFEYPTATRRLIHVPVSPTTLDQPVVTLHNVFTAEGVASGEGVSRVISAGDINGDGRPDAVFASDNAAYVVLGSERLDPSVADITEVADYVIDLTAGGYQIADTIVDLDGDGLDDLTFHQTSLGGITRVRVLRGSTLTGTNAALALRGLDQRVITVGGSAKEVAALTHSGDPSRVQVDWIQYDDDGVPDLAIFAELPTLLVTGTADQLGYGVIRDGAPIATNFEINSVLSAANLLSVGEGKSNEIAVSDDVLDAELSSIGGTDQLHVTFGDIDGDGRDDLIGTFPYGWKFDHDEITAVALTHRIAGGTTGSRVSIGDRPVIAAFSEIVLSGDGRSQTGALNQDTPVFAGDLDSDGRTDLVFVADYAGADFFSRGVARIMTADTLLDNSRLAVEKRFDAQIVLADNTNGVLQRPSVSIGDFDGDRISDLAITEDGLTGRRISVFYDALNVFNRSTETSFDDERIDNVIVSAPVGGSTMSGLPIGAFDLSGDGIDDLLFGSGTVTTSDGLFRGGAIYGIAGGPRTIGVPGGDVTELANDSIRGIGDIIRDSQGDFTIDATLADGTAVDWYRFRSLGDGRIGDRISLSPYAPVQSTVRADGVVATIPLSGGDGDDPSVTLTPGGRLGALELDLGQLLSLIDQPGTLVDAELGLTGIGQAGNAVEPVRQPEGFTVASEGRTFFRASTPDTGIELYVTNGSPGDVRLVEDLTPGPRSSLPGSITAWRGGAVFTVSEFGGEEEGGEIGRGPETTFYFATETSIREIADRDRLNLNIEGSMFEFNGDLYVTGYSNNDFEGKLAVIRNFGGTNLMDEVAVVGDTAEIVAKIDAGLILFDRGAFYLFDGSGEPVEFFRPGGFFALGSNRNNIAGGDRFFFTAADAANVRGAYVTDGTAAGTKLLQAFDKTDENSPYGYTIEDKESGGVYFASGRDIWYSGDDGTSLIYTPNTSKEPLSNGIFELFALRDTVVLLGRDGPTRIIVQEVDPDGRVIAEEELTASRNVLVDDAKLLGERLIMGVEKLFNSAPGRTYELLAYDVPSGQLSTLDRFIYEPTTSGFFNNFVVDDDQLLYAGYRNDNIIGEQVWRSDGSPGGTYPVQQESNIGGGTEVTLNFAGGRNDGRITGTEDDQEVVFTRTMSFDETQSQQTLDLSSNLEALRDLLDQGYRSIVVTMTVTEGEAQIQSPGPDDGLFLTRSSGVEGRLIDGEGRLIADDFSQFDMRNLPAGEYFIGVSRPSGQTDGSIAYDLQVDAPLLADGHDTGPNDRVDGGDGDDVVIGGPGKDRVFGGSGRDTLVAEVFERRDADAGDFTRGDLIENRFNEFVDARQERDPIAVIGVDPLEILPGQVVITQQPIAEAIGAVLGVSVVTTVGGDVQFARPVHASELSSIAELDLSNSGVTDLEGLQHLVGLRSLNLSGNNLDSTSLSVLRPRNNDTQGLLAIEHLDLSNNQLTSTNPLQFLTTLRTLNLSDQRGVSITSIGGLRTLEELRVLTVAGNSVTDLSPLRNLSNLRVLDASGNIFAQQGLNQLDLRTLIATEVIDARVDGIAGTWHASVDPGSVGGSYLYADLDEGDHAYVWNTGDIPSGRYELFGLWHGDSSHTSAAQYAINGQVVGVADQRLASRGRVYGDREMQSIGLVEIGRDVSEIRLSGSDGGLLVADAIVLRPSLGSAADSLVHLEVRGTTVSDTQRDILLGELAARDGVVQIDVNKAPTWIGPAGVAVSPSSNRRLFADVQSLFDDDQSGSLVITANVNHRNAEVRVDNGELQLNAPNPITEVVTIELTATDAFGATTVHMLPLGVGYSLGQGSVRRVSMPDEGTRVVSVSNRGREFAAISDRLGNYTVLLDDAEGEIELEDGQNIRQIISGGGNGWDIGGFSVVTNQDFSYFAGAAISNPGQVNEGDVVTLRSGTFTTTGDTYTYQWQVDGPGVEANRLGGESVQFKPTDSGIYTATLVATRGSDGRAFVDSRTFFVDEVASQFVVGDDVTASEGDFALRRSFVVDPGDESVLYNIDYGNGDPVVAISTRSGDAVNLQTFYGDAGTYTINVLAIVDGERFEDSFDVTVTETLPTQTFTIDEAFIAEGLGGVVEVSITDPSRSINRTDWTVTIDWGDGQSQSITDDLTITGQGAGANGKFTHDFPEGSFSTTLRVIDGDGETFEQSLEIVVSNDTPLVTTDIPGTIIEDQTFLAAVDVIDADAVTIAWDFGDGSAVRTGDSVRHVYSSDDDYVITVTVTDADGATVVETTPVNVTPVNDSPTIEPIAAAEVVESFEITIPTASADPDGDNLDYSLINAPVGVVIDDVGVIHWTPTIDQGGTTYTFEVLVSDGDATATAPVTVSVLQTGSISGSLFVDVNGDGIRQADELPLTDGMVKIDEGDDGVVDRIVSVDAQGNYLVDSLPIGLYRVFSELGGGLQATTPLSFVIDMVTPRDITLPSIGGSDDIDGDGISNDEEDNSLAGADANDDGILDSLQSYVASIETVGGPVTLVSDPGTTLQFISADDAVSDSKTDARFPFGRLSFSVAGLARGGRADVEIRVPNEVGVAMVYTVDDQPDPLPPVLDEFGSTTDDTIDILANRVLLTAREGGVSDIDGNEDGRMTFSLQPAAVDATWTNPSNRFDVSGDNRVTPLDALLIINALQRSSTTSIDLENPPGPSDSFLDVNGDDRVTAMDVLWVLNQLRRQASAEGEWIGFSPKPASVSEDDDIDQAIGRLF
ncbi:Bifunctional hemolysin/adenylate cyclase precursor [Crateriforma conspicua]|nr:Bifunctional hemolysin/adenylate cyclase precursor [Crateriforma conspicua]